MQNIIEILFQLNIGYSIYSPTLFPFSADVKMVTKQLGDNSTHIFTKAVSDTVSNKVDQTRVKSRSPVSLEIYMPSTTGRYSESLYIG